MPEQSLSADEAADEIIGRLLLLEAKYSIRMKRYNQSTWLYAIGGTLMFVSAIGLLIKALLC